MKNQCKMALQTCLETTDRLRQRHCADTEPLSRSGSPGQSIDGFGRTRVQMVLQKPQVV